MMMKIGSGLIMRSMGKIKQLGGGPDKRAGTVLKTDGA